MKADVVVIGCGVIGAAIAWELTRAGLSVIGLDQAAPASGSTGAALGVLIGVSAQQTRGAAAQLRLKSLEQFDPFIATIEAELGRTLPVNRRGILHLLKSSADLETWQETLAVRQEQGFRLQGIPGHQPEQIIALQPHLNPATYAGGGIYSPQDRQVDPSVLTHALIGAARQQGAEFFFHQPVTHFKQTSGRINAVYTPQHTISAATVVLTAGLGSTALGSHLNQPIPLQAVKGQALRVYAPGIPGGPVITAEDLHLVPLPSGEMWIGATVEFGASLPGTTLTGIQRLIDRAIEIYPHLGEAELRSSWMGLRPRPTGQRAPVLGFAPTFQNLIIATGHYRNGVLLAPITAAILRDLLERGATSWCNLSDFVPKPALDPT